MNLTKLLHLLYDQLNHGLPGENAHALMAPYKRPSASSVKASSKDPKMSAVLLLLYSKQDEAHFILIQRPEYEGTHGGQVSFPGGKQEKNESLKETALRETNEEIGICTEEIQILGELTQVYIPPSNFLVSPFIGFIDNPPRFLPDSKEVEDIVEVKVADLLNDAFIKQKKIQVTKYTDQPMYIEVPYFDLNYKTVWGATAVILSEFRQLILLGNK